MDAYNWEALYQQQPVLRAGNYFKREWFVVVDEVPFDRLRARVRYWDKAGTEGGGDYTVGVLMSLDVQGYFYVEHVERGQWSPNQRDEAMLRTAKLDKQRPGPTTTIWHQQDPGSAGLESAQATNRLLVGYAVHFELVSGSKESRADPLASQCEVGRVRLVRGAWNEAFIEELCGFPRGRHDDQVDGGSGAFSKLAEGKDGWMEWARGKLKPQITQIDADGKEVGSGQLAVGSGRKGGED
jgi:predicted phage terminase large subunit-like protein